MAKSLHTAAATHAASLIKAGKIDHSETWTAPTADEENRYLEKHSNSEFGLWHLGVDSDEADENKGKWSYPYSSDFERVSVAGLRAIAQRAGQSDADDIQKRAHALLEEANAKSGKKDDKDDEADGDKATEKADDIVTRVVSAVRNLFTPPVMSFNNAKSGKVWLTVVRNDGSDEPAEMIIDGTIGESWYDPNGVAAADFRKGLNAIPKNKPINVRINSQGGSVGDALAMYHLLQERGDSVTCTVDGYALSSGSIVALGGARTCVPPAALMMIHNPWSETTGDANQHQQSIDMLDTHADSIAGIYAKKTGKTVDECKALMDKTTWMTGSEAVAEGFADASGECPKCGHPLCDECDVEEDEITCSECGESSSPDEWQDEEANNRAAVKVATLTNNVANNVPAHVVNMISAHKGGEKSATPPTAATGNTKKNMSKENNTAAAEAKATPALNDSELTLIRAQLLQARKDLVSGKIDGFVRAGRMTNDERTDAVARALADETYLDVIAKRPQALPGGSPIFGGFSSVEVLDDVFAKIKAEPNRDKRVRMRLDNWKDLYAAALRKDGVSGSPGQSGFNLPMNASSVSTSLVTDVLSDHTVSTLVNTLAPLSLFFRDFTPASVQGLNTLQVRLLSQAGQNTSQGKDAVTGGTLTDYEASSAHTYTAVPVTMQEYSRAVQLTSAELFTGFNIESLNARATLELGTDLLTTAMQPILTSSYTAGQYNGTVAMHPGSFSWNIAGGTDMAVLRAQIGKSPVKNAILSPDVFSKLVAINIANGVSPVSLLGNEGGNSHVMRNVFGWDAVAESSVWPSGMGLSGTVNSTIGFACADTAVVCAARLPFPPMEGPVPNLVVQNQITLPGLGMTVLQITWFSTKYMALFSRYAVIFGAAAADLTAGCHLKSLG